MSHESSPHRAGAFAVTHDSESATRILQMLTSDRPDPPASCRADGGCANATSTG